MDADDYERRLCTKLIDLMPTIVKQMRVTQELTETCFQRAYDDSLRKRLPMTNFQQHSYLMTIQGLSYANFD
jgi:hypothetical protein